VKTKGTIYLSNIRMVFVASKPVGNFFAFDMPLVSNAILKVGSLFLLSVLYNLNKMQGQKHRTKKDRKKGAMAPTPLTDHDTIITNNQHKISTHVFVSL
jgi:hypothetical protein